MVFYIVKKNGCFGKTFVCYSRMTAYEWYDGLYRANITIEEHRIDTDANGDVHDYVTMYRHMSRRTLKDGTHRYYLKDKIRSVVYDLFDGCQDGTTHDTM